MQECHKADKKVKCRKCVGCNELKPSGSLIKITKNFITGELVLNPNSKTFGRSAYLCYNQNCIEMALRKNKLCRILKTTAQVDKEALLELLENEKGQLDGQY